MSYDRMVLVFLYYDLSNTNIMSHSQYKEKPIGFCAYEFSPDTVLWT